MKLRSVVIILGISALSIAGCGRKQPQWTELTKAYETIVNDFADEAQDSMENLTDAPDPRVETDMADLRLKILRLISNPTNPDTNDIRSEYDRINSSLNDLFSQEPYDFYHYTTPSEVALPVDETFSTYPQQWSIHPVGWSAAGRFAYVLWADSIDTIGASANFKLMIMDPQTGETSTEYDYFNEGVFSFGEIWTICEPMIRIRLIKAGIQQEKLVLNQFPYIRNGESITAKLVINPGEDRESIQEADHVAPLINYELIVESTFVGILKTFEAADDSIIAAKIGGYFVNSTGKRIAIPVAVEYYNTEGRSVVMPSVYIVNLE